MNNNNLTEIDLSVQVKRLDLIYTLKTNLENHKNKTKEAHREYRKKIIEICKVNLARAHAGQKLRSNSLIEPQDFSQEYKRAISMLELTDHEFVTLTSSDYARFYMDQWSWSRNWEITTSEYL